MVDRGLTRRASSLVPSGALSPDLAPSLDPELRGFVLPGDAMTSRADLEHAIAEHHATITRLEADPRTEPALIAAVRARRDELLEEWAQCRV